MAINPTPMTSIPTTLYIKLSPPDGSTVALETTRLQMRKSKAQPEISIVDLKAERLQQHTQEELGKEFYCKSFESLYKLVSTKMDVTQTLALFDSSYGFVKLRVALDKSWAEGTSVE
jgi:hypothetical protein